MARAAAWLLGASLVLGAAGWASSAHAAFEALRLAAVVCLGVAMLLLIVDYAGSPEAMNEDKP